MVLQESATSLSQAEYFIRTGLSKANTLEVVAELLAAVRADSAHTEVELSGGVEEIENPRRPRPAS